MKRLKDLEIPDSKTLLYARKIYRHAESQGFFDYHRKWLAKFHQREIEEGVVCNVEIRRVPRMGYGAFATASFKSGDYIGIYTGALKRRTLFGGNSNDYCFRIPTTRYTPWPLMIDAQKAGNETRFINHSDNPNVSSTAIPHKGLIYILLSASALIPTGAQLFIDYGERYWKQADRTKI